jgi:hypothetical protein
MKTYVVPFVEVIVLIDLFSTMFCSLLNSVEDVVDIRALSCRPMEWSTEEEAQIYLLHLRLFFTNLSIVPPFHETLRV